MKKRKFCLPPYVVYAAVLCSLLFSPLVRADGEGFPTPPPAPAENLPVALTDPNAAYLVFIAGDSTIVGAMENIGATNVRYRSNSQPVTSEDWDWCDIVILGSNDGGDSVSGIKARDIETGITGRVVLSGHDVDLHASDVYSGSVKWAAQVFFIQTINYVLAGEGKGLIGFGDTDSGFEWAPQSWELAYTKEFNLNTVLSFTEAGAASGVFEHLTPTLMSDWYE